MKSWTPRLIGPFPVRGIILLRSGARRPNGPHLRLSVSGEGNKSDGKDIKWFREFSPTDRATIFSGGEHAWDLVTSNDQALATGLYLFTVKDLENGEIFKGKFVVIK